MTIKKKSINRKGINKFMSTTGKIKKLFELNPNKITNTYTLSQILKIPQSNLYYRLYQLREQGYLKCFKGMGTNRNYWIHVNNFMGFEKNDSKKRR